MAKLSKSWHIARWSLSSRLSSTNPFFFPNPTRIRVTVFYGTSLNPFRTSPVLNPCLHRLTLVIGVFSFSWNFISSCQCSVFQALSTLQVYKATTSGSGHSPVPTFRLSSAACGQPSEKLPNVFCLPPIAQSGRYLSFLLWSVLFIFLCTVFCIRPRQSIGSKPRRGSLANCDRRLVDQLFKINRGRSKTDLTNIPLLLSVNCYKRKIQIPTVSPPRAPAL